MLIFFCINNDVLKLHEIYHFIQRGLAGEFIKGAFFPLSTVFLEYSNMLRMMNQYIFLAKNHCSFPGCGSISSYNDGDSGGGDCYHHCFLD